MKRLRRDMDGIVIVVFSVMIKRYGICPGPVEEIQSLLESALALMNGDAEVPKVVGVVSDPDPHNQPAAR